MAPRVDKASLMGELLRAVSVDLDALERAQRATVEGATHSEAKPENDKDTRALEQTYLARGQAMRVEQLRAGLADLTRMELRAFKKTDAITHGSLVTLEEEEKTSLVFIVPHGGGTRLAPGTVQVVTPLSPLGAVLVGKSAGDGAELLLGGKRRELEIVDVR